MGLGGGGEARGGEGGEGAGLHAALSLYCTHLCLCLSLQQHPRTMVSNDLTADFECKQKNLKKGQLVTCHSQNY